MTYSVKFNGQELNELIDVTWGFTRGVIAPRTNTVQKIGNRYGSLLLDSTLEEKTIKMPFIMLSKSLDKIDKLAYILDVNEEKELIFEDQPERYYRAIPSGSIDFDELRSSGKGTITWLISDGFSYSINSKIGSNHKVTENGKNLVVGSQFNLENAGWQNGLVSSDKYGLSSVYQCDNTAGGSWYSLVNTKIARQEVDVKKGDTISWSLTERTKRVGKNGAGKTFCALVEEYSGVDTPRTHYQTNQNFSDSGEWETLKSSYQIVGEDTKYISLTMMYVSDSDGLVQIAEPMLVIGNELPPYEKSPIDSNETIKFNNGGTYKTPIKVKAEMQSDNGFLGLTLGQRYYQIGNPGEVDAVPLPPSEMIVKDGRSNDYPSSVNDKNFQPLPNNLGQLSQTGSITKDSSGIRPKDYGTSTAKSWAGPSITWKFPQGVDAEDGAQNFFLWQNAQFETSAKNEAGFQVHTIHDDTGKRIFSMVLKDQSGTTNQSKILVYLNDKKVYEANNQWTKKGYIGYMSMTKSGNNFVVVYGKTTKTFVMPELKDNKGLYYTIGFGKWFNNPAPKNNKVMNWTLRKDKVDKIIDVPNFFKTGDIVELDSNSNMLTINGVPDWDRVDIGSRPLIADVGSNEMGIVVSDFATMPKVDIEYKERWL